ncbi:Repetitive proline-rich cell wall protein 1 [Spatholobus suberectus]|nr:Repetitive proline-rich cell wall protein 1 [Spatholobus suberectus]
MAHKNCNNEYPVYDPPVYLPPVYEPPVYDPPVYNPPVYDPPVYHAPVYHPPVYYPPVEATYPKHQKGRVTFRTNHDAFKSVNQEAEAFVHNEHNRMELPRLMSTRGA